MDCTTNTIDVSAILVVVALAGMLFVGLFGIAVKIWRGEL